MNRLIAPALAAVLGLAASTHAATILIDVGNGGTPTPANDWNNATSLDAVVLLDDTTNTPTGITATFGGWDGANSSGATMPTTPAYPSTAYIDSFFLNAGNTGTVTFTGLDSNTAYTFTLLASRGVDGADRAGTYTLTGANSGAAVINAGSVSGSTGNLNAVTITPAIQPNGSNIITLSVTPTGGSSFAYLNVIQIDTAPLPEPASLGLLALGGTLMLVRRAKR